MEPTLPADAEERILGVAFLDLAGFGRWAATHSDRRVAGLLQGVYELAAERLGGSGGHVVKVIGDAMLVVFEPGRTPEIVETLHGLATDLGIAARVHGFETRLDARVHLGPVVAGSFGPPGLERFDVLGRTVNDAALLQGEGIVLSPLVETRLG